jgi:hypothetical protein
MMQGARPPAPPPPVPPVVPPVPIVPAAPVVPLAPVVPPMPPPPEPPLPEPPAPAAPLEPPAWCVCVQPTTANAPAAKTASAARRNRTEIHIRRWRESSGPVRGLSSIAHLRGIFAPPGYPSVDRVERDCGLVTIGGSRRRFHRARQQRSGARVAERTDRSSCLDHVGLLQTVWIAARRLYGDRAPVGRSFSETPCRSRRAVRAATKPNGASKRTNRGCEIYFSVANTR